MQASATIDPRAHKMAHTWDRLWTHQHTDDRDDELLARERRSKRWRLILDRAAATFGSASGLRTIELGSGRGDLSALLAQEGAQVTLLDSSHRALQNAQKRFERLGLEAKFVKGDLFAPVYETFDLAISSGVIEHFSGRSRTQAIQAHRAALRPGGLAIVSVPNARCIPYRIWKAWLELRSCWPYGFEKPYSRRELARRARQAGFSRLEIRGCGFRQALHDQFLSLLRRSPNRNERESILDDPWGLSLVLFGWNS